MCSSTGRNQPWFSAGKQMRRNSAMAMRKEHVKPPIGLWLGTFDQWAVPISEMCSPRNSRRDLVCLDVLWGEHAWDLVTPRHNGSHAQSHTVILCHKCNPSKITALFRGRQYFGGNFEVCGLVLLCFAITSPSAWSCHSQGVLRSASHIWFCFLVVMMCELHLSII